VPETAAEVDFLRLHEITPYLDACADHYRPVAGFLIGSGCPHLRGARAALARRRFADCSVRISRRVKSRDVV
jgi:hypothetical protein